MVQILQDIRGGGGSIKLGTTGTISALMSRELQPKESVLKLVPPSTTFASVSTGDEASRTPKFRTSADEASCSSAKNPKSPQNRSTKHDTRIPMLKSGDDGTPKTKKPVKKHSGLVDIVDIKCGGPSKTWVNPITHRLKKLGFSKLSDTGSQG